MTYQDQDLLPALNITIMNLREEHLPPRGAFDDVGTTHPIQGVASPAFAVPAPEWVLPFLEVWQGIQLLPKIQDGYDVEFGSCFGNLCPLGIKQLSMALGESMYPIAALAERTGILLTTASGSCFTVSVDSNDACSLGTIREAVRTMLLGNYMRPLLPERIFPQWHNADIYEPGDNRVHWIITSYWWAETRSPTHSDHSPDHGVVMHPNSK